MNDIRYAIADDHNIFRKGLKLALSDEPNLVLAGEAANGLELLDLLKKKSVDVVLLDIKMPQMDGMETILVMQEGYPDVKVIILTMYDDEHFVLHLVQSGANGYLLKNADPEEIKKAIYTVCETGHYFNDLVNRIMLKKLIIKSQEEETKIELTNRELKVLRYICQEHTAVEIAEKMFISTRTVEGIRSGLLVKVGVRNTAGLVLFAVKNGIFHS